MSGSVLSTVGVVALVVGVLTTAASAQDRNVVLDFRERDDAVVARNILPPGQGRHLNDPEFLQFNADGTQPPHNTDQFQLYEELVRRAPDLTEADVETYFKDASFGVPDDEVESVDEFRDGDLVVLRDGFGVPHIFGATDADAMWGAGYVSAADRLFVMDVLRHLGRGRLSQLLGASEANLQADRAQRRGADYTDDELTAMADRVETLDPVLGPRARGHLEAYVEGINAFIQEALVDRRKLPAAYDALQQVPREWTVADTVATSSLIGADFSPGGGGQIGNAAFLESLLDEGFSPGVARQIFDDFRFADDPEAPHTVDTAFPFLTDLGEVDPDAVKMPDDPATVAAAMSAAALPEVVDGPFGPLRLGHARQASNALLVSSELSATGRPIAVMGPQVGYFTPQILMEMAIHAPNLHARGATFPGVSLYVLLGRGQNYAWSATTANGDHRDIRAVALCEPDGGDPTLESTHYLDDGDCVEIFSRTDTWLAKPTAGGIPQPGENAIVVQMTTERTRHGIVQARGAVDGVPHAFVLQRSSYNKEVDATLAFTKIHDPGLVTSMQDLKDAFVDFFSYSFNWFLMHDDDIGFQLTGHYPILPQGVDPDLPINGDRRWDPVGGLPFERADLLPKEDIPNTTNPAKGYIVNWNGKQAPRFRAADAIWSFGPTQRAQLLEGGLLQGLDDDGKVDLVELARAMEIAATQDLYGAEVLPLVLEVIGDGDTARHDELLGLLADWADGGAHRRDLDDDGEYEEQPAVALFDAFWSRAVRATFEPTLGGAVDVLDDAVLPISTPANPGGSAYFGGWHGQLHKDLRAVLGRPGPAPFSRSYCGEGDAAACRDALLGALDDAAAALEAEFDADPSTWDVDEDAEAISFEAIGVASQELTDWQNRPTFQQVLEFGPPGTDAGGQAPSPGEEAAGGEESPLPATGGGGLVALIGVALAAAGVRLRRRGPRARERLGQAPT